MSDDQHKLETALDERNYLVGALKAIQRATLNGDVCPDVAWFDQIETLHDFCERILEHVGSPKQ